MRRGGTSSQHPTRRENQPLPQTAHYANLAAQVKMRYFLKYDSEENRDRLKKSLEKTDQIQNVTYDQEKKELSFVYRGPYAGLIKVQNQTVTLGVPSELVSHAYLILTLVPGKDYDEEKLKEALQKIPGMKRVCCIKGKKMDLWVDLAEIDFAAITRAGADSGCTVKFKSHRSLTITLGSQEKVEDYIRLLSEHSGILMVQVKEKTLIIQTRETVRDFIFEDRARKAGVTIVSLKR